MTKNAYFGPNLPVLWPKILILTGGSKSFGTHIKEKPPRHLACIVYWSGMGPNGPKRPIFGQKCNFDQKNWIFGNKSQVFVLESRILSTGYITSIHGATTIPFGPPQRNFPFPRYGSFSGARPGFWPFWAMANRYYKYP